MPNLSDRELLKIIDAEFTASMGAPGGDISTERAKAWDYYLSKPFGDEIEGQSQVVTSDVADVVDGVMPSLLRLFTTADNLVNFDAVGPEDEEQAEQASDYVNHVFFKQNDAFLLLYTWFFDALVQKNGFVKVWWDKSERITQESYSGLSDNELFELMADDELEAIEHDEREAKTLSEDGRIIDALVHDVTFRRVAKSGQVKVDNVPPEEFRISADARSLDPSDARMVGQEREITKCELLEMGFDKVIVDALPSAGSENKSSEKRARRDKADESDDSTNDLSQQKVLVRQACIRVDYDQDGRAELRQVISAGNVILSNEPTDRQEFHVISPQPLPHKHFGQATAEKVMDIQQITSVLVRQVHDNLYHTNNPGNAVWEQALGENTLDDLLTTRVGRTVRFSRPIQDAWAPITIPFTADATFPMIEYWDKIKRDRTGVNPDSEGLSPVALKNIQTTVMSQATDLSKMKIEAIARIFAETGIKTLMLHIHELVLKHQQKAQVVKLRNKWVQVDPREWRSRMNMTVNIGLGIGTREQNLMHLNAIWEKQLAMVNVGGFGTLVTPKNLFNTAAETVKNANFKQAELFFTETDEIKPQNDEQNELIQQQMQLAARQQELDGKEQEIKIQRIAVDAEDKIRKFELALEIGSREQARKDKALELKREEVNNKMIVAMENIATRLTELELESARDVPGSKV